MTERRPGRIRERATIADVARFVGVSKSTVSNVMNGRDSKASAETRAKVQAAAELLNYEPRRAAQQLRRGRADMIGVLVPTVANPFWGEFVRAVEDATNARGLGLLVSSTERDREREIGYAQTMLSHGVEGIIFASSPLSIGYLSELLKLGVKVVVFDRSLESAGEEGMWAVSVDNYGGGGLVGRHLAELGHQCVGVVSGPVATLSRRERVNGLSESLIALGSGDPRELGLVVEARGSNGFGDAEGFELGYLGTIELLKRNGDVTAVFGVNDMYALGCCRAVLESGRRIPDDVSVVGFDDIFICRVVTPSITTVRQPVREMAREAVDLLTEALYPEKVGQGDRRTASRLREFKPELMVRDSTGPAPQR